MLRMFRAQLQRSGAANLVEPRSLLIGTLCLVLVAPAHADQSHEYLRERLEQLQSVDQTAAGNQAVAAPAVMYALYHQKNLQLIWNDERRDSLLRLISRAPEFGLDPEDYHYTEIKALGSLGGLAPQARVNADMLLTEALMRVGYHARFGKVDPATLDANFNYGRSTRGRDPVASLESILAADDIYEGLVAVIDPGPAYRGLVAALAKYRGFAEQGEWARNHEALVIKARRRKSGGCAVKECVLTWGDLALYLKG